MSRTLDIAGVTVSLVAGDLSSEEVDAAVVPMDGALTGSGGVAAAMLAAGGESYQRALEALREEKAPLSAGEVALMATESLRAKNVILSVGPDWRDGYAGEFVALEHAYHGALKVAIAEEYERVAFASIATGAKAFPDDRAAYVAFNTYVRELPVSSGALKEIRFIVPAEKLEIYGLIWDEIARTMIP